MSSILNDPAIRERLCIILYCTADAKDSPQSIARIDRTARKVDICRTFVRSVLQ